MRHAGFFVVRTPLLEFTIVRDLMEDWRRSARQWLPSPIVQDAIFVAAPALADQLSRKPDDDDVLFGGAKYLLRMAGRPTPFGLFSTCARGVIGGSVTAIELAPLAAVRRSTRLDFALLHQFLDDALNRDLEQPMRYRLADTFISRGRSAHVVQSVNSSIGIHYELASIELPHDPEVLTQFAERTVSERDLIEAIGRECPDASTAEVTDYVASLIAEKVFVPFIAAPLHSSDTLAELEDMVATISPAGAGRIGAVRKALQGLDDRGIGQPASAYQDIAAALPAFERAPWHVESFRPVTTATIDDTSCSALLEVADTVRRIGWPDAPRDTLTEFKRRFRERYEERWVPFLEAVDADWGIGWLDYGGQAPSVSPLLKGIPIGRPDAGTGSFSAREQYLLSRYRDQFVPGGGDIVIDTDAIAQLERKAPPFPDTFSIVVSPFRNERGELRWKYHGGVGSPGGRMLGRFGVPDADIKSSLEELARIEESLAPDAIVAEVIHAAQERAGNVTCRPPVRRYEIPVAASRRSDLHSIPLSDLLIALQHGRLILWSSSLNAEVQPRCTTAYNPVKTIPHYRVLAELQHQGVTDAVHWNWGCLSTLTYLPRVILNDVIISGATWTVRQADLKQWNQPQKGQPPDWVELVDSDNSLPLNWRSEMGQAVLLQAVRRKGAVQLRELLPHPDQAVVSGPGGRHAAEIVIPFVNTAETRRPVVSKPLGSVGTRRNFSPGSEWLYARLDCAESDANTILAQLAGHPAFPMGEWFFVRYWNPLHHVRVRVRQTSATGLQGVADALGALLDAGRLGKFSFETYERETERYGGEAGIEVAESIFCGDSRLIAGCLAEDDSATLWPLAVACVSSLAREIAGPDGGAAWLEPARDGLAAESAIGKVTTVALGGKYRELRPAIDQLVSGNVEPRFGPAFAQWRSSLAESIARYRGVEPCLNRPLPMVALSLAHMMVNRCFVAEPRSNELVVYDFVIRSLRSMAARHRQSTTARGV